MQYGELAVQFVGWLYEYGYEHDWIIIKVLVKSQSFELYDEFPVLDRQESLTA